MTARDDTVTAPLEAGLPRRFLRAFLLLTLERGKATHGYELCESVRTRGVSVELAAVYRDLRSMQQHDLVTSQWEPSGSGPDRRVYELTATGRAAAAAAHTELVTFRDGLSAAIDSFAPGAVRTDAVHDDDARAGGAT